MTLPRLYSITPQADLRSAFRTGLYLYIRVASHRTWPLDRCEEVARLREQEAADVLPGEEGDEGDGVGAKVCAEEQGDCEGMREVAGRDEYRVLPGGDRAGGDRAVGDLADNAGGHSSGNGGCFEGRGRGISSRGDLVLENLTVRYASAQLPSLRSLSLRIPGGSTVGVVGRTGAGKSTLGLALFRLLEPSPGAAAHEAASGGGAASGEPGSGEGGGCVRLGGVDTRQGPALLSGVCARTRPHLHVLNKIREPLLEYA